MNKASTKRRPSPSKRRPPSIGYGPGRYTAAPNGRGFDCVISRNRTRIRARLPDEASARAWIDAQDSAHHLSRHPLTRAQMLDAQDALALLPPGTTLLAAARALAAATAAPDPLTVTDAATRFHAYLSQRGIKHLSARGYRIAINALTSVTPADTVLGNITPADILRALGTRTGVTRNNVLRHLATFFRWAVRERLAAANPVLSIPSVRVPEPPRGILTVPQAAALLGLAEQKRPALVPYLALALFAGIRPGELARLDPARIGADWIVIDGRVAKTASHRTVPIRPNLRAWLDASPPNSPIPPLSTKHLYAAIRSLCRDTLALPDAAAHIPAWPADCMRHSYASYAYDLTRDAARVASEMGHQGTDIFFRHYRGLVHPGDGGNFFSLSPKSQRHA